MWTEIDEVVRDDDCKLSVYADDLTMSGDTVHECVVWDIKMILFRHGHRYAKHKERSRRDRAVEITGVILTRDGVSAPNRQRRKIVELREDLVMTKASLQKEKMEAQLRGRLAQLSQIQAGNTHTP